MIPAISAAAPGTWFLVLSSNIPPRGLPWCPQAWLSPHPSVLPPRAGCSAAITLHFVPDLLRTIQRCPLSSHQTHSPLHSARSCTQQILSQSWNFKWNLRLTTHAILQKPYRWQETQWTAPLGYTQYCICMCACVFSGDLQGLLRWGCNSLSKQQELWESRFGGSSWPR